MGLFRRDKTEKPTPPPRAVMAAAMPLAGPDVIRSQSNMRTTSQTSEDWQREAWYFYDAVGELRSPVNWIANAISKADIYAAEIDTETGLITGPTDNQVAQRAATACLGGAAKRAQAQYILAVCWQVPGEAFVIIRPSARKNGIAQPDQWLVLSGSKVKVKGGSWTYCDPGTGMDIALGPSDRLIRVWSPHPNDQAKADTAVRPALPILREIEKSSMNISSRLDSRLASNGILPFPSEANFPTEDGKSKAESVTSYLMEAMEAAMSAPGTASAQVPIMVEMPMEMISAWKDSHMDLSTDFDASIVDLRDNDLGRLASTLDMPKEVAAGTTGEANHWSAWQVEESTYKIYIEPLLQRLSDALTEYWFRPALAAMGVSDPERYVLDWDTSEIVARPDRFDDLSKLYDLELISDDYMRTENGIPDDAAPDDAELSVRRLEKFVGTDPTLLEVPEYAEILGLPQRPVAEPASIASTPVDGAVDNVRALPTTQGQESAPQAVPDQLAAAAGLVVKDALTRAGGRLLTNQNRGRFKDVPKWELHTVVPVTDPERLLADSFQFVDDVAQAFGVDAARLDGELRAYTRAILASAMAHDPDFLNTRLRGLL